MQKNKLNIALIGYGNMGKIIEKLALQEGHSILLKTTSNNRLSQNIEKLNGVDVAIEFTSPHSAPQNLELLAKHRVPTICGSTAWLDEYERIIKLFEDADSAFLYASNFSIGVNIFFAVNKALAKLMDNHNQYIPTIYESHHIQKKDAPSGTAVSLAQQIINNLQRKSEWVLGGISEDVQLSISADRIGDVKGFHEIKYSSDIDKISISHEAFSREGFAAGALLSANFIQNKKGIFNFSDVLKAAVS